MQAVIAIDGRQYRVVENQKLCVGHLKGEPNAIVSFDRVLYLEDNGKTIIGTPVIEGASVKAKILEHLKDDKVIVFKKKRRKGYSVKRGHRQQLTRIIIEKIEEKAEPTT